MLSAKHSSKTCQWILAALLLGGLYLPTSIGGNILKSLMMFGYVLVAILLMGIAWMEGVNEDRLLFISLPIVFVLCFFTLFSSAYIVGLGVLPGYAVIAVVYALRLEGLKLSSGNRRLFLICNVVSLFIGFAAVFHWDPVNQFVISTYSDFYDDLVPQMLGLGEPVLTFATHSLAGFFLFLFFWLNLRTYLTTHKPLYLVFAVCFFLLEPLLLSVSGFLFAAMGLPILVYYLVGRNPRALATLAILAIIVLLGTPTLVHQYMDEIRGWGDIWEFASGVLAGPATGFLGRYGSQGNNLNNLAYVMAHPFRPVGLTTVGNLFIGDSGPIEYLIRGSLPFVSLMYGGLFLFLKRNMRSKVDSTILFVAIMSIELGFTALTYLRMLFLLPFAVIYLNSLDQKAPCQLAMSRMKESGFSSKLNLLTLTR